MIETLTGGVRNDMQTRKRQYRLGEPTERKIAELAVKLGGPVRPLTEADVVRECVRRVHSQEMKKEKRR